MLAACAVAALCVGGISTGAQAQSDSEAMRRLEAKIDSLAKENATLKSRLTKVEAAPRAASAKKDQGYVGPIGNSSVNPTPQQVNAAREAYAADMPVAVKYAPPPRPACAQFGGWQIGINGGWASIDSRWVDRDAWVDNFTTDWALGTVSNQHGGVTIGGHLGYLWQSGCTVFGFEFDAAWADLERNKIYDSTGGGAGTVLTLNNDLQWYGSARTRTGLIVDNLMLYVTGGLAYAKIDNTWTINDPAGFQTFSADNSRWGGVLGLGAEWAFNANWSLRTEFLYYIFQEVHTNGVTVTNGQVVNFDSQDSMWVSRFALTYRWGDYGKAPVMAKY